MKTFDEKDLITWANREKAVIGNEYYFADSLIGMKNCINNNCAMHTLDYIDKEDISNTFRCYKEKYNFGYSCILSIDKVIEKEPEKKYRACKTIKEFFELVMNGISLLNLETNNDFAYELIYRTIHFRNKNPYTEYYSSITSISINDNADIRILFRGKSYLSFEQIFENYEIEINGEWLPFGVEE